MNTVGEDVRGTMDHWYVRPPFLRHREGDLVGRPGLGPQGAGAAHPRALISPPFGDVARTNGWAMTTGPIFSHRMCSIEGLDAHARSGEYSDPVTTHVMLPAVGEVRRDIVRQWVRSCGRRLCSGKSERMNSRAGCAST